MRTTNLNTIQKISQPLWTNRSQAQRHEEQPIPNKPVLRFSPTAWAKLQFFCHQGKCEIGGFGISSPDDLLRVEEFLTVAQTVSSISVAFDDSAVADFFDEQVDAGRKPQQFGRIWPHTHPGSSPNPSSIDEDTFARVFGGCDWAVMFILSRTGRTYARLRFNVGPGGQIQIPVEVDYSQPFAASDHEAWLAEYQRNIHVEQMVFTDPRPDSRADKTTSCSSSPPMTDEERQLLREWEEQERQEELDNCLGDWAEEGGCLYG
jgi:proteasome lid subunit RPN8/RPN11